MQRRKDKTGEFTFQSRLNIHILLDIITVPELALLTEVCTRCLCTHGGANGREKRNPLLRKRKKGEQGISGDYKASHNV